MSTSLELYFTDSRSLLIVFLEKKKRFEINQRLASIISRNLSDAVQTPGLRRTPMFGRTNSKLMLGYKEDELSTAQRKWQAREISNVGYEVIPALAATTYILDSSHTSAF